MGRSGACTAPRFVRHGALEPSYPEPPVACRDPGRVSLVIVLILVRDACAAVGGHGQVAVDPVLCSQATKRSATRNVGAGGSLQYPSSPGALLSAGFAATEVVVDLQPWRRLSAICKRREVGAGPGETRVWSAGEDAG